MTTGIAAWLLLTATFCGMAVVARIIRRAWFCAPGQGTPNIGRWVVAVLSFQAAMAILAVVFSTHDLLFITFIALGIVSAVVFFPWFACRLCVSPVRCPSSDTKKRPA